MVTKVQILDKVVCLSYSAKTLGESMHLIILPPPQPVDNLGMVASLGKGNLGIFFKTLFKKGLCFTSGMCEELGY